MVLYCTVSKYTHLSFKFSDYMHQYYRAQFKDFYMTWNVRFLHDLDCATDLYVKKFRSRISVGEWSRSTVNVS